MTRTPLIDGGRHQLTGLTHALFTAGCDVVAIPKGKDALASSISRNLDLVVVHARDLESNGVRFPQLTADDPATATRSISIVRESEEPSPKRSA